MMNTILAIAAFFSALVNTDWSNRRKTPTVPKRLKEIMLAVFVITRDDPESLNGTPQLAFISQALIGSPPNDAVGVILL